MSAAADIGMRARIVRFGVSGAASTALHAAIAGTLMGALAATAVQANAIAFVCATGASYLLNTLWSFSVPLRWRNVARFLAVSVAGLMLTMAISHGVQALGIAAAWSIAAVVVLVPPLTFAMHRLWTYR
ncbi:GtrA family protein [Burkholderia thailandensis]|uniref:GtrA-like protein family n=1 Tax=Burkholderia thailandensis (strain ATCC 700388 / DSM 13276 / CCUG 48851 / CIP 106301 / E264) TaxID=271848 RepID=Q2T303_BURTA|nr:GtrA family protein [Burkholderia thailandensis]ABC36107.1 GtrA-like protein family [Burkholderia thailandensis E264]AHI76812.1 gtrA-like family protein [Burkholderia thailandensis 2002721723]AHI82784.1 gtrA-like family protein [Burkholderia thailandensis E444]AIC89801.1 gtrA-like family protein [Burkholderia thailandensis USAMRU Malaysia \